MEAGRELDILVSEKIFGYTDIKIREFGGNYFSSPTLSGIDPKGETMAISGYSENIHSAFQVIKKLDLPTTLEFHKMSQMWQVEFRYEGGPAIGLAPTASEAICLAALKVVGHFSFS